MWTFHPTSKFDPKISGIMEAVIASSDRQINYFLPSEAECQARAEKFRHFRYCVRKEVNNPYFRLEQEWDFRSKVNQHQETGEWYLSIRAIPARLGTIYALNPWLAEIDNPAPASQ